MKIRFSIILFLSFITHSLKAQYAEDALRSSETTFGGTARIQSMAGAQTAIGGEIGNLSGNPAGLGFYRRSDFSLSPALRFGSSETEFLGNLHTENRDNFNISSMGFVITQLNQNYTGSDVKNGWVSYSFGLGVNRINTFHSNRFFSGFNTQNSLSQFYSESANQYGLSSDYLQNDQITTMEDMAYASYIVDYDFNDSVYYAISTGNQLQKQRDKIKGAQNMWSFAFGANYSNKLYLGASIGLGSLKYRRITQYEETGITDTIYNVSDFKLNEDHNLSGTSFNLKLGFIYRPIDLIRIGASIQTPDYYSMIETFTTDLRSTRNDTALTFDPLRYVFEYNLRAPFRINYGVAFFFKKYGFISADVEQVNYGQARLNTSSDDINFESKNNSDIKNTYKKAFNYRFGGEVNIGSFALRAGYAIYGDPFKNTIIDRSRTSITGGMGYKIENYYVDLAFINTAYKNLYTPYTLNNNTEPRVNTNYQFNTVLLTIGTKF